MSKNTIFKSIVVFFVALLSMSTPCHACWDEYDDDYYDYDSYDDWDYWDDWEDYYNWDDEYYCYDGNTWLDDTVCTADRIDNDDSYNNDNCDDWNNSDSYNDDTDNNNNYSYDESNETEYESGDNFDNSDLIGVYDHDDGIDEDEYDDSDIDRNEDDYEENDQQYIEGHKDNTNKPYIIQDGDKTCIDKKKLDQINGFKQGTSKSCVCAGIELCGILLGRNIPEGETLLFLIKSESSTISLAKIVDGCYNSEMIANDIKSIFCNNGLKAKDITDIKGAIDDGCVVMTVEKISERNNHDVIIVGYNSDGYIAYDTDRNAGHYTIIREEQINSIYIIGVSK